MVEIYIIARPSSSFAPIMTIVRVPILAIHAQEVWSCALYERDMLYLVHITLGFYSVDGHVSGKRHRKDLTRELISNKTMHKSIP